jgi:xylose isomerase
MVKIFNRLLVFLLNYISKVNFFQNKFHTRHTFRGTGLDIFGAPTLKRPWDNLGGDVEASKQRANAAFEFFTKLGVDYYTFHDRDIAPEGKNLKETNLNLDKVVEELQTLQEQTGVKLLWGTANMCSQPRNANGAATNPDFDVFAYSGAQVILLNS